MADRVRTELMQIIESFISEDARAESDYEKAIKVAVEAGFPEIAVGLKQIRKDVKNHKDALELMLLGVKAEEQ